MQCPAATVLTPVGGMGVTVWLGMSRVALRDKVGEVFRELAHTRHQGPEQYQGETAIGTALHGVGNLNDSGVFVKRDYFPQRRDSSSCGTRARTSATRTAIVHFAGREVEGR